MGNHRNRVFLTVRMEKNDETSNFKPYRPSSITSSLQTATQKSTMESAIKTLSGMCLAHFHAHSPFFRKAQYSFAWDWGPSFPTVGIARGISITQYNGEYFHDFKMKTNFKNGQWHMEFEFDTFHYGARQIEYIVRIPELSLRESDIFLLSATKSMQTRSKNKLMFKIPMTKQPERWWPNGMGEQKLYDVVVTMGGQGDNENNQRLSNQHFFQLNKRKWDSRQ